MSDLIGYLIPSGTFYVVHCCRAPPGGTNTETRTPVYRENIGIYKQDLQASPAPAYRPPRHAGAVHRQAVAVREPTDRPLSNHQPTVTRPSRRPASGMTASCGHVGQGRDIVPRVGHEGNTPGHGPRPAPAGVQRGF